MEVFITAGKQLFIVLLILVSLPLACKLLWWLRLLPLAVYLVTIFLFFLVFEHIFHPYLFRIFDLFLN